MKSTWFGAIIVGLIIVGAGAVAVYLHPQVFGYSESPEERFYREIRDFHADHGSHPIAPVQFFYSKLQMPAGGPEYELINMREQATVSNHLKSLIVALLQNHDIPATSIGGGPASQMKQFNGRLVPYLPNHSNALILFGMYSVKHPDTLIVSVEAMEYTSGKFQLEVPASATTIKFGVDDAGVLEAMGRLGSGYSVVLRPTVNDSIGIPVNIQAYAEDADPNTAGTWHLPAIIGTNPGTPDYVVHSAHRVDNPLVQTQVWLADDSNSIDLSHDPIHFEKTIRFTTTPPRPPPPPSGTRLNITPPDGRLTLASPLTSKLQDTLRGLGCTNFNPSNPRYVITLDQMTYSEPACQYGDREVMVRGRFRVGGNTRMLTGRSGCLTDRATARDVAMDNLVAEFEDWAQRIGVSF